MGRWLGIDFSGSRAMWGARCSVSNVWIAEIHAARGALRLASLRRVQELPGATLPFERLRDLLAAGAFDAAAIDVQWRCAWPTDLERLMLASADAPDAMLCGLAAFAVSAGEVSEAGVSSDKAEGQIAVHR